MIQLEHTTERGTTVRICTDTLCGMTPAQRLRARRIAQETSYAIAQRAMIRGAVEGVTEEEYRRRYGITPSEAWARPMEV